MIRFYRNLMTQILFYLVWLRDNGYESHERVQEHVLNHYARATDNSGAMLIANYQHRQEVTESLAEIIELLNRQLYAVITGSRSKHEGDLIDTVVRLISSSYSQNVLAGKTLDQLRKAILTPEELIALQTRIAQHAMSCSGCGRELIHGELVSVGEPETARGEPRILCAYCKLPQYIATAGNEKAALPKLAIKWIKKAMSTSKAFSKDSLDADENVQDVEIREPGDIVRTGDDGPPTPMPTEQERQRMAGRLREVVERMGGVGGQAVAQPVPTTRPNFWNDNPFIVATTQARQANIPPVWRTIGMNDLAVTATPTVGNNRVEFIAEDGQPEPDIFFDDIAEGPLRDE